MDIKPDTAMSKLSLYCVLLVLLFTACKKEKKPVVYDITGNWALYSYQTNFGVGVDASVVHYPCMSNNILTFYSDSTAKQFFLGTDTCFVTATHKLSEGARFYGLPGLGITRYTWSIKGSNMTITPLGDTKAIPGTITTVSGKLQLTLNANVLVGTNTYFINTVEVKQ